MMFFRSSRCGLKTGGFKLEVQQRGAVAVLAAVTLAMLLGFAALAIDIGYLFVVRNELQNAADAAALAGAGYLYPETGTPLAPNWDLAKQKASTAVSLNKSSNFTLADSQPSQVTYGYWDMAGINGLQASTKTPGPDDLAAVMVTISRDSGQNGGAVSLFLAGILGIPTAPVAASAVAVVSPGSMSPGKLFPVAIFACLYDNYWVSDSNPPGPRIDPGTGNPYIFKIGSDYHYLPCPVSGGAGQWTSFDVLKNDDRTIDDLITGKTLSPILSIGENIYFYIPPGTKNNLYNDVDACSEEGNKKCKYVAIAVVDNLDPHTYQPIVHFACLHIDLAVGGNDKYIQVEFTSTSNCPALNSGGSGPFKPRLAQ